MTCPCRERIGYTLEQLQKNAKNRGGILAQRVEAFQSGIKSGAEEIALRHLFRAGVYWGSLDNNLMKNPSNVLILTSLGSHIAKERPGLNHMVPRVHEMVHSGGIVDDPKTMLKKVLRSRGPKSPGLLQANAVNEVQRCEAALNQAQRLQERLAIWREGMRLIQNPEAICIVERHGDDSENH